MAAIGGRGAGTQTEKPRSPASDEELKETLERDTAVQGDGEGDAASETRRAEDADHAPRTTRPVPRSDRSK